jgi:negative regulator of sigma E activity
MAPAQIEMEKESCHTQIHWKGQAFQTVREGHRTHEFFAMFVTKL